MCYRSCGALEASEKLRKFHAGQQSKKIVSQLRPEERGSKPARIQDRIRPPFGKRVIGFPRQCVLAGTVNHAEYLRDETGARRFWPVRCSAINVEALARHRDELWAEAGCRYTSGEKWWLDTSDLVGIVAEEQAARYQSDPWEEIIAPWLNERANTSVSELLDKCLNKPQARWTQTDKTRIARCLRALGWDRYRERQGSHLEWCYRRMER